VEWGTPLAGVCTALANPSQNRTTPFYIQNPSLTQSQKPKESYETPSVGKCQRVSAGALYSVKECGKSPAEGSEGRLGAGGRKFESCHPDQNPLKNRLNRRFFSILGLIFRVLSQIDLPGLGLERFYGGGIFPAAVNVNP